MKKFILLPFFLFACTNYLFAQVIGPVIDTYKINVTRNDNFIDETIPGHAHTNVTLDIKIGSNERTNSFSTDIVSSKDYSFPIIFLFPGTPPPVTYVKVTFSPSFLSSGYYPLNTNVGDQTIIPAIGNSSQNFGYGTSITCIAKNKYTFSITRFNAFSPNALKNSSPQNKTSIVHNPSLGFSELYYTATAKETISINVIDIYSKIVSAYTTDVEAGLNKLPINIQNNHVGGTYIVQWKSSNGTKGTLKMVKQ